MGLVSSIIKGIRESQLWERLKNMQSFGEKHPVKTNVFSLGF